MVVVAVAVVVVVVVVVVVHPPVTLDFQIKLWFKVMSIILRWATKYLHGQLIIYQGLPYRMITLLNWLKEEF